MNSRDLAAVTVSPRLEMATVLVVGWLAFASVPLWFGAMSLSWDALNHHIYLGWIAGESRFDRDFLAPGYQALTFPYLYWPVYKLAASGAGPVAAGVVLASLHFLAVPPVWMIARVCIPGAALSDAAMRALAVLLAFLSGVVLAQMDTTSNDLMAAVPLLWSIAFALEPLRPGRSGSLRRLSLLSGLMAGVGVACKLSNGPIVMLMPLFWLFAGSTARERLVNTFWACVAMGAGLVATYGYWGAYLWSLYGNPVYPFGDGLFAPVRAAVGWAP